MGTIRVEYVPVQRFGLGFFGFDHLHLVYQDEADALDTQDFWYVLEGVQDGIVLGGTLGALGEDGRTTLAAANDANRDELIAKIGTPEDRGSRILTTGPNAFSAWLQMANYAADIEDQQLPYIAFTLPFSAAPTINSTSFIASVLWSAGINLSVLSPFGMRTSPGASTLIGTSDSDDLTTTSQFSTLVGGLGNDQLRGGANNVSIEKLYGGEGNDTFLWSTGDNVMHGGQPRLAYQQDGLDTVDYSGVGFVTITANTYVVEHKIASFNAVFEGGRDALYSVEQVAWDRANDVINAGEGIQFLERPLLLDLKGSQGALGDQLGLEGGATELVINTVGDQTISIQTRTNQGLDAGYWANSVETLIGSDGDDLIYAGGTVLTVDGGAGDDTVDGRNAVAFSQSSPEGYDIDLYGGDGDDTIVSGTGRTVAYGGAGSDSFVLASMTTTEQTVEFVIEDAGGNDKLYLPYDFFQTIRGDFDGSELLQVSGAPFKIEGINTESYFIYGEAAGESELNEFVGAIKFTLEGSDLIINPMQGSLEEMQIDNGPGEPPGPTFVAFVGETSTEATIRVRNWSEGVLGISFPILYDPDVAAQFENLDDYPGVAEVVLDALSPSRFLAPLDERPDAHVPLEIANALGAVSALQARSFAPAAAAMTEGGDGDDTLFAESGGPYTFHGYAGNDTITGSLGGDVIDGGLGADVMDGGRGNDLYFVDDAGDQVVESAGGGFDRVIASIDYVAGAFIEHVALKGSARTATGNALRNTLEGNELDNTLLGGGGDDTLAGNGGNDTLIGGAGDDGYVYEFGDGNDTIFEDAADGAHDVLVLAGGLKQADVTLIRDPGAPFDLVLAFSGGGRITIANYYLGGGYGIEGVRFEADADWAQSELETAAAGAIATSNAAPVAMDDIFSIAANGTAIVPLAALIANDRDADGDALTLYAIEGIAGATATIDANGALAVTPDVIDGETATVALTYTVSDGRGGFSSARLDLAVRDAAPSPPNTAPVFVAAALDGAREDQPASGRLVASDADGDALIFALASGGQASKGTVEVFADGTFSFTPLANANGADRFAVTVSDGRADPVRREIDFTIAPENDAPVAFADTGFAVKSGATLSISAASLIANDRDIDGDSLSVTRVHGATGGTVSLDSNGDVVFAAAASASGPHGFTYLVSDGNGGSADATVALHIDPAPANANPVVLKTKLSAVHEDKSAHGKITATDGDGDRLHYAIKAGGEPAKGSIALKGDGTFVYTPKANANGAETFTVIVSDGQGGAAEAAFNFTIKPVNDAPMARNDSGFSVANHASIKIDSDRLIANDRDIDGDQLKILAVTCTNGGSAHVTRDGDVVFTAKRGFSGEAKLAYKVSDGHGGSDTATVTIDVERKAGWHGSQFDWDGGSFSNMWDRFSASPDFDNGSVFAWLSVLNAFRSGADDWTGS